MLYVSILTLFSLSLTNGRFKVVDLKTDTKLVGPAWPIHSLSNYIKIYWKSLQPTIEYIELIIYSIVQLIYDQHIYIPNCGWPLFDLATILLGTSHPFHIEDIHHFHRLIHKHFLSYSKFNAESVNLICLHSLINFTVYQQNNKISDNLSSFMYMRIIEGSTNRLWPFAIW